MNPYSISEPKKKVTKNNPYSIGTTQSKLPPTTLSVKKENLFVPQLEGEGATTDLGIAYNTVQGLPKAAVDVTVDVTKEIGQGIVRSGLTVGRTLANATNWGGAPQYPAEDQTKGTAIEPLTGGKPVSTLPRYIEKGKEALTPIIGKEAAGFVAPPLALFGLGLDLTPWGGARNVKSFATGEIPEAFFKAVAKEQNPKAQYELLKQTGLDDQNARMLGAQLAPTKTVDEAKDVLAAYEASGIRPRGTPQLTGGKTDTTVPVRITDALLQEAGKYRSAEKFEKKYDPTDGSFLYDTKPSGLFENDMRTVRLNLFPEDLVKGTGITKTSTLNLLKDADSKGIKTITPSLGSYTKEGIGFMDKLASEGWVSKVGSGYEILPKIKEWQTKTPLTDLWKQAQESTVPPQTTQTPGVVSTPPTPPQMFQGTPPQRPLPQSAGTVLPNQEVAIPQPVPDQLTYQNSIQKKILDARDAKETFDEFQSVSQIPGEYPEQAKEVIEMAKFIDLKDKAPELKDINVINKNFRDIYRNTEEVFGKDFKVVDNTVLEPFNQGKSQMIDFWNQRTQALSEAVVDRFKIYPKSKESAAVEQFGEGKITYDKLVEKFGAQKAQQIAEADSFFRASYDSLLNDLNKVEQEIYPNNPEKWTPKLANYYRHGHETTSSYSQLESMLGNPIHIDPMLVGVSDTTKPLSKWASFKQRRLTDKREKPDAVSGYLEYLKSVGYALHIDPHIGKFRELADVLRRTTTKSKNLNNYIEELHLFANQLAGKTNEQDRLLMNVIGRTPLQAVDWLNKRVKANTILGSVSASLAQSLGLPQVIASAGIPNSLAGAGKTFAQNFVKDPVMAESTFLKERYFKGFDEFDRDLLSNPKKFVVWMVTALDEAVTRMSWNSHIAKFMDQYRREYGVDETIETVAPEVRKAAVKYADDTTKKLVGGRGVGEKPLIQESKLFQVAAPFQLEVANLWHVMDDMRKTDKSFAGKIGDYMTLFVGLYIINSAIQEATGNRPALDPVQMTMDAAGELQKGKVAEAVGRVGGEFLSNIPVGQTAASFYPEYGGKLFGTDIPLPQRKELFGRNDPTRFGSGLLVTKSFGDPLFKVLPPFAGGQIKKTIEGIGAVNKGYSETQSGAWQYDIDQTIENYIRAALFGKYGTTGAQDYYKNQGAGNTSSGSNPYSI